MHLFCCKNYEIYDFNILTRDNDILKVELHYSYIESTGSGGGLHPLVVYIPRRNYKYLINIISSNNIISWKNIKQKKEIPIIIQKYNEIFYLVTSFNNGFNFYFYNIDKWE